MQVDKKNKCLIRLPVCARMRAHAHASTHVRMGVFSLLDTFISVRHLPGFMMKVVDRKIGSILQNFASLLKILVYIYKMNTKMLIYLSVSIHISIYIYIHIYHEYQIFF